ncbi:hypothetical protein [Halonotius roseus]|uniref:Uncharacterized protein n=1 Tax=Halonotius roseus TaxID=2511997 RepID=A0A544QQ16_9EURY|nr:hypothetical protein [Halonotius roseus]TQQ81538.1 hypothetical protein EWF95_00920 [Halonotius roseus]
MPSTSDAADSSSELDAIVTRYHRLERAASGVTALLVGLAAVGLILALPLWQGVLAAVTVLGAFRIPLFTTGGTARLRTGATPATVRDAFVGPRPPVLALQWGIADSVTTAETGGSFELSYLLGLRSITMATTIEESSSTAGEKPSSTASTESSSTATEFTLRVTAGDSPWGSYDVTLTEQDGNTLVEIDVRSDRRFGLRGLPAWLVAQQYYDAALDAQGYTVLDRERSLSLRGA